VFTEHILGIATNEVSQEEFAKFYRENSILLF
jgi:hypothetical protein